MPPIYVGEMELSAPEEVRSVGAQNHVEDQQARILIRLHAVPLGFVEVFVSQTVRSIRHTCVKRHTGSSADLSTATWIAMGSPLRRSHREGRREE